MKKLSIIVALATLGCVAASSAAGGTPPYAVQKVLKQYGLDSEILRSPEVLETTSSRKDGLFPLSFPGNPGFEVLLDRDYWVLASWSAKGENNVIAYALNPSDEQSALNITIGSGLHERSDTMLKKDPGFSGITRGKGVIANRPIEWRRWSDQYHLYSDCTVELPPVGAESIFRVNVSITANSVARRAALEDCMANLRLVLKKPNQAPEPTTTAVTPPAAQEPRQP